MGELVNKTAGLIAGFLIAISPFTVRVFTRNKILRTIRTCRSIKFYLLIKKEYLFFVVVGAFYLIHYTGIIYLALMVGIYLAQRISTKIETNYPSSSYFGTSHFFSYSHSKLKEDAINASWIKEPSILSIKKSTYAHLFGVTVKSLDLMKHCL